MSHSLPTFHMGIRDRGVAFVIIALLFTILASISVLLRLYVRLRLTHGFGLDDTTISFAIVGLFCSLCHSQLNLADPGYSLHEFQHT